MGILRRRLCIWSLCHAASLFLIAGTASASVDYFDLAPEALLSAEILSASRKSEKVSDAAAAVFVITHEDIVRSGVTSIPDALRMVPGMHVAQIDSNSWAINIRGFNNVLANKLLVMIDGRAVYNPLFGGTWWETQDVVLEDIDRIEVIRGPGGTLWGANAVNGVINILTRHSRETQGNLLSVTYGNEERGRFNARHGGIFSEDGTYRVYAKGFNRDSSHDPDGGDAYDEWAGYRGGFRADWDDTFTLQGDVYHTETEQYRFDYSLDWPYAIRRAQTIKYQGGNILARWTDLREDSSQLTIQSYLDWSKRDEPYNFVDRRFMYDLEAQYNLAPQGRHEIIVGSGFRFIYDDETGDGDISFSPEGRRDQLYSAFIQDKITLVPEEWYLTLGSKFEYNEYSGFEVQPNVRMQWHPDPSQTFWAAVSRAVRTPTPVEHDTESTFGTGPFVRAALRGNRNFDAEEMISYEAGYRNQVTPDLSFDATAFYNDYNRLATISALPLELILNPFHILIPLEFRNDMKGKVYGAEIAAGWAATPDLKISGSYSLLRLSVDAEDNSGLFQEGAEDIYPAHQAGVQVSWNINGDWTLDTGTYYVDRLKGNDTDDYVRMDVNIGYRISDQLRFNLVAQNLTDTAHREYGPAGDMNLGEVERSVFGKLTWKF